MNRLAKETSPYLLQHQDNPVDWWAWGPEALAEAKRTNKPILLSVGYAACHWCHVMAHESFEDEPTAQLMNDLYVNIKVDREERPDIDAIYMGALHRLGEQGGWPLTMFLDSEARPFWGGTYFPKQARYGRPGFAQVLLRIAEVYQTQPENVASNAERLVAALKADTSAAAAGQTPVLNDTAIRDLVMRIARAVDPNHGGLRGAPKFPQWNVFWLLWRGAMRFDDAAAKQAVITTLKNICQGGIYDHLGGGFARYSVDEYWLVPHFEKMLYDNALLIDLLTEVWRETQEPVFAARIAETVQWLRREMIAEGGGFAASLDADSEGEEGKFYVWSADEIREVLSGADVSLAAGGEGPSRVRQKSIGEEAVAISQESTPSPPPSPQGERGLSDAAFFAKIYNVTDDGNFEGHTILNRLDHLALLNDEDELRLARCREKLLKQRATRIRPGWDDKVLADWNGLMIAALARASAVFEKPDWLEAARRAFAFVESKMHAGDDRLWHSARAGKTNAPGTASDYSNMTWAALRLFETTLENRYLERAKAWTAVLDKHHWDAQSGGYFTAADDTRDVIVRLKSAHDDAVPSANTIQLSNLIALGAITGDAHYEERAEAVTGAFGGALSDSSVGHCGLIAATMDVGRLIQIAVSGSRSGSEHTAKDLSKSLSCLSIPGAIELLIIENDVQLLPSAFHGKVQTNAKAAVFVCQGPVCGRPVSDPEALTMRLVEVRRGIERSI